MCKLVDTSHFSCHRWLRQTAGRLTACVAAAFALLNSGCVFPALRAAPVPQRPTAVITSLPSEWSGRTLYVTDYAYIYASSPATAAEVARQVAPVAAGFAARAHCPPPAKVIIVAVDNGEEAIQLSWRAYLDTFVNHASISAAQRSGSDEANAGPGVTPTESGDGDEEADLEELRDQRAIIDAELLTYDCGLDTFWGLLPLPLLPDHMTQMLGFPGSSETDTLAMLFPTHLAVQKKVADICERIAMHDQTGILGRVVVQFGQAWVNQKVAAMRDTVLFILWVTRLPAICTPDEQKAPCEGYARDCGLPL